MKQIKQEYPVLQKCVYLDTAATMQKHHRVIDVVSGFSKEQYANIHRGIYPLSVQATHEYENTRDLLAGYLQCNSTEIVFTKGATESMNLLAASIKPLLNGTKIAVSAMEHHSSLLPWQRFCKNNGYELVVIPITDSYELDYEKAKEVLTKDVALVCLTHMSNVLGSITDVQKIKSIMSKNTLLVLDACQSIAHTKVTASMADFIVCSSHKIGGPTGIGILYAKKELLNQLEPYHVGGDMVKTASFDNYEALDIPSKFEAGTPNIEGVIGFGEALELLEEIGYEDIQKHDAALTSYAVKRLESINGLTIYGGRNGIISFTIKGIHSHDIAQILGDNSICVRAGHHCCMPLLKELGVDSLTRVSLWMYNDTQDIDSLIAGLQKVLEVFA